MTLTPSWLPDGTVYGTLLNFRHERELWTVHALEAPYKAPPQAPVLYIKTANTFSCDGAAITLPDGVPEVEIGASLGLVVGNFDYFCHKPSVEWSHSAINREVFSNLSGVAGCVLLNDLAIPHASYYRPPVKFKCLDGFLGIGPQCLPLASVGDVNALKLDVRINGVLCQTVDFTGLARNAASIGCSQLVVMVSADPHDTVLDEQLEARLLAGDVKVPVKDGEMVAYRALPKGAVRPPVVLVVSEIFGVHEHIQDAVSYTHLTLPTSDLV